MSVCLACGKCHFQGSWVGLSRTFAEVPVPSLFKIPVVLGILPACKLVRPAFSQHEQGFRYPVATAISLPLWLLLYAPCMRHILVEATAQHASDLSISNGVHSFFIYLP